MPRMPDPIYFTTKTQRHRGWIDPLFLVSAFRLFVPIRVIRAIPACRRPGAGRRGKTPRLGSDPRSISPRITRISRMQRCSSHAKPPRPRRLQRTKASLASSSSLFARDADASGLCVKNCCGSDLFSTQSSQRSQSVINRPISVFSLQVSGLRFQVSGLRFLCPGFKSQVSSFSVFLPSCPSSSSLFARDASASVPWYL